MDERCSRIWPVTIEAVGGVTEKRRIRAGRYIVPHDFRRCFFLSFDKISFLLGKLGMPSFQKSAVFLNIVQKAFDPPPFI